MPVTQNVLRNWTERRLNPFVRGPGALTWGKVTQLNDDGTVNVALQSGGTLTHVPVSGPYVSSQTGEVYLPQHDLAAPIPHAGSNWDVPGPSGKRDTFALVGYLEGSTRRPTVIGFLAPKGGQMQFMTKGIYVQRHESGTYRVTLPDWHDEMHWPDGSYFIAGSDTTPHDMTAENASWNPNTETAGYLTLHHPTGAEIQVTPAGQVAIASASGQSTTIDGSVPGGGGVQPPFPNSDLSGPLVSGVTAGTGISVSGNPSSGVGSPTITNSGVTSLTAGTGITLSGSTGNVTVSSTASGGPHVADVQEDLLTTTNATTVATYTPTAQANYVARVYFRVVTATTTVTVKVTYADAGGAQTNTVLSDQSCAVGSYSTPPVYFNAVSGTAIAVVVTAGTASQVYVSGDISQA